MPHTPSILATIVLELVLAASGGLPARKLCLRPLVKYLAAGSAIGPSTPGFIGDANLANQLAEIGVILGDLDAMNAVPGRQVIPAGSTAEVIERLPSGADFMRVVKVKVTLPNMKATTGLTIEINR